MDDFPLTEEFDDIVDIRVIRKTKNIVIGDSCLLLCGKVLNKISHGISLDLHGCCGVGETGSGGGVDTGGVIHEVGRKGTVLNLAVFQIPGQLMDDGADHFQVSQFFCTCIEVKMKPRVHRLLGKGV